MIIILLIQPSIHPLLHSYMSCFFLSYICICVHTFKSLMLVYSYSLDEIESIKYIVIHHNVKKKERIRKFLTSIILYHDLSGLFFFLIDFFLNKYRIPRQNEKQKQFFVILKEKNVRILFRPSAAILILKPVSYFFFFILKPSVLRSLHFCLSTKVPLNLLDIYISILAFFNEIHLHIFSSCKNFFFLLYLDWLTNIATSFIFKTTKRKKDSKI
jgi:hypothetical protein